MAQLPAWQRILILFVALLGLYFAIPNLFPKATVQSWPTILPHEQINLGLDLRGGAHLLLEVDLEGLRVEQRRDLSANILVLSRQERIGIQGLGVQGGVVRFSLRDPSRTEDMRTLLEEEFGDIGTGGGALGIGGTESGIAITATEDGRFTVGYTEDYEAEQFNGVMQQTIEVIRRRIDETGTREALIARQGGDRVLVQVPGFDDTEQLKTILGTTARMGLRFVMEGVQPGVDPTPAGASVLPTEEPGRPDLVVSDRVIVSGESLEDAQLAFDGGIPVVNFRLDATGARRFCDATRNNVGRRFAIVLDEVVISAPVIRDAICGGNGQISGGFTNESARDLALLLRAGALPAALTIIEERTVGPGLGADSIEAGEIASLVGVVAVVLFMVIIYGLFGAMAAIALILNLILIMAALTALQATLTLPGIAGIALTMGMAVDANVLIFERIREEARNGRSAALAIDAGFKRAVTTIVDSNVTTLIAAVLLYQFGSGPVKGFAVTLSLGLASSMFSAMLVTRWMVLTWARRQKRGATLPIA